MFQAEYTQGHYKETNGKIQVVYAFANFHTWGY